jgi:hypothetical protein
MILQIRSLAFKDAPQYAERGDNFMSLGFVPSAKHGRYHDLGRNGIGSLG